NEHFDEATEDDEPEQNESHLCAEQSRCDEFAAANDIGADDQARANLTEYGAKRLGSFLNGTVIHEEDLKETSAAFLMLLLWAPMLLKCAFHY
ncbi:MAG: hypothetical protein JSW71_11850, partial [Gemmatimonadota bacterium]